MISSATARAKNDATNVRALLVWSRFIESIEGGGKGGRGEDPRSAAVAPQHDQRVGRQACMDVWQAATAAIQWLAGWLAGCSSRGLDGGEGNTRAGCAKDGPVDHSAVNA